VLIPEFLNPLDDQQRWKGYPFDGIALTHFVGISGVEDARNVVAAKLPRTIRGPESLVTTRSRGPKTSPMARARPS